MAQVGIGTKNPDKSAMLDIEVSSNNLKGVLIPRVPLKSLTDNSNINNGKTTNSLLVFNTTQNTELNIGYYYWFETTWIRLMTDQDNISRDIPKNDEFAVNAEEQSLYLKDTDENIVSVPLRDINVLTTLENKGKGIYVYTSEDNSQTSIDVVADVTNNFESVITNEDVQNALNVYFTNSIPEGNVTYVKEGNSYVFKYLDEKGDNQTIDISEVVKSLETITTITPEIVDGKNTGKYVYKNEEFTEVTIDVVADVTNNFESVITNEDVENSIYLKVANKGQKIESTDGVLNIKGGDKAVLSNTKISVNNKSISTEKIKPGVQGQLLITNTSGDVQWVDATDDIIKDVIALNESVTLIKDLQDGTFVYYNEDCFDKDGKFIEGSVGISFDANTLSIKENAPGLITFSDKKGELKVLDIRASNIIIDDTTIGSGNTNVQDVLETIIERITVLDNQSGALSGIGISINQGTSVDKAVLQDINLSIDKNAIDSEHIKADAVLASKIKDGAVTQEKLWAGKGKNQFVAVAQNDGTVKYQAIGSVIQGDALSTDNSLEIEGDASGSLLKGVKVQVAPNGIVTKHIENNAITAGKIGSAGIDAGAVLTTDGSGGTLFVPIIDAVDKAFNADIIGDAEQTVLVEGGENVLIGDKDKKVTITINKSGIKEKHIANGAVTAQKLNAEDAKEGSVATVGKKGAVSYQPLTTDLLQEKGNILSGTTISAIQGGVGSVLTDVTLEVNDQSITATKLIATEADKGAVATVGDNGIVSYKPLTSDLFQNKGTIATDNIIAVSDNGIGKVLEDVTLSINDNSIATKQLANNAVNTNQIADLAVTNDKITSGNIGQGRVLLSDEGGKTQWGELDKIYDAVAGNLSTDNIITIMPNEQGEIVSGERALLKDINLGIKDESITNKQIANQTIQIEKLNSKGATDEGMVMVTTKEGGFTYMSKSSIVQKGEDLEVNDGLKFLKGNGKSTVLAATIIGIEDQGITSDKLREKSVTTAKISSEGADTNAVLTADGKGAVTYKVLNENIFTGQGADLVSDESIEVTANNKALLQETSIAIAKAGVNTQHLKDKAVTTDKISSKQQDQNANEDALLVSDGQGGTMFKTLDNLALKEGKELKTDASITVKGAENALLKEVTIQVATNGIQEEHLNEKSVTIEKINSGGENAGLVLLTDGEGGASFQTVTSAIENTGKTIYEGDAIAVDGGKQAALKDVTISLKNKGVTNQKIADKTIKAIKIDADKASSGTILTSVGDGEAKFLPINSYGQKLDSDTSITVSTTDGVLLAPALIKVSETGIRTEHLGDKVVTIDKLSSVVDQNNVEAKQILLTDGEGGFDFGTTDDVITKGSILQGETISAKAGAVGSVLSDVTLEVNTLSIDTNHIKDNAVSSAKINKNAVVNEKIAIDAVTTSKIKNKTISFYKISSGKVFDGEEVVTNVPEGQVITADGEGGVIYKSLSSQGKKISTDQSINVTNGGKAVLSDINISVADKGVTPAKISSEQAKEGAVLVADGKGGAVYKELKASMPKFFYLPSIALDVTPGKSGTRNIYEDYATQFGKPKYVNPKAGANAKLPVLPAEEFNFYITYLEDSIFDEVSISDNGVLTYKVKQDAVITNMSYMNIVLEVRE
ncbi:hypothetical protein AV926_04190 [Myroides marinus]|uniref:Uncharacterized protein n=2 Tax=Myroides marinus TaxID=703342 RepID=A0A164AD04_9FLAO|nr:hypothetical protein AV926_04190 [Myroides marinus]